MNIIAYSLNCHTWKIYQAYWPCVCVYLDNGSKFKISAILNDLITFLGPESRAGPKQESWRTTYTAWCASSRECATWSRQVQDITWYPKGQHQKTCRWIWKHVNPKLIIIDKITVMWNLVTKTCCPLMWNNRMDT